MSKRNRAGGLYRKGDFFDLTGEVGRQMVAKERGRHKAAANKKLSAYTMTVQVQVDMSVGGAALKNAVTNAIAGLGHQRGIEAYCGEIDLKANKS